MTKNIVIIIPCYNEGKTLGKVIADFQRELPDAEIVVVDNNSTDNSVEVAQQHNVILLHEKRQGKGYAMRRAFDSIDADYYIMVDGDDTYPAKDVHKLLQPVMNDEADMVIGTRLENANDTTLRPLHQLGNWIFVKMVQLSFQTQVKDLLSGYRVMSKKFINNAPLLSSGFEIETELSLQAFEKDFVVLDVPIVYRERPEGSESKLRSFHDGWRILRTIISLLRDYKPMTFFSLLALFFVAIGLLLGGIVIADYLDNHIVERTPTAILSTLLIILGFLSLLAGLIVGTINRRFQELNTVVQRGFAKNDPRS